MSDHVAEALKHNGFHRSRHAPDRLWVKHPAAPNRYTAYLSPDGDRLIIHQSRRDGTRHTINLIADLQVTDDLQAAIHAALS